ncbi:MAG: DNA integrity scanning protein DisA nucleotide-binding domain protein [Candidatus Aenigmatarchaeota archaeon]
MLDRFLGRAAKEMAHGAEIDCIALVSKLDNIEGSDKSKIEMNLVRSHEEDNYKRTKHSFEISRLPPASITQVREIIVNAVNRDILKEGDKIACITDESLGKGFKGVIFLFTIDEKFMEYSLKNLEEDVETSVLETVLEISREIGKEGREGEKIGTGFVISDLEEVETNCKQLVMNPFKGYPPEEKNIMNPEFKETLKEFSQIDGVFIVDNEGFVHKGGVYLNVDTSSVNFPGLGARNHALAAITKQTDSVSVSVSESGGIIRIYRNGKMIREESPE